MADPLEIDVFWSFRSPWSYLATPRLAEWQRRYALDVRFRPVYPIAVRMPEWFDDRPPLHWSYFARDLLRVAEFLEIPISQPKPDPVAQEIRDGRIVTLDEQPHVHRLTRLGVLAEERGHGIDFADEVSRLIFGGTEGWDQGDHLARAAGRAGLDLSEMDEAAKKEARRLDAEIERNQADHETAGHWGVPTCAFRGEPFFGQDRLDVLLWRLKQNGLAER